MKTVTHPYWKRYGELLKTELRNKRKPVKRKIIISNIDREIAIMFNMIEEDEECNLSGTREWI